MTHGYTVDLDRLEALATALSEISSQADVAADAAKEVAKANHLFGSSFDIAYGLLNQPWAMAMSNEWEVPGRDAVVSTAEAMRALVESLYLSIDEYRRIEAKNRDVFQRRSEDLANVSLPRGPR